jgi:hypothetical protein
MEDIPVGKKVREYKIPEDLNGGETPWSSYRKRGWKITEEREKTLNDGGIPS